MHVAAAREREESESESAGEMKQGSCEGEGEGAPQRRESCASPLLSNMVVGKVKSFFWYP